MMSRRLTLAALRGPGRPPARCGRLAVSDAVGRVGTSAGASSFSPPVPCRRPVSPSPGLAAWRGLRGRWRARSAVTASGRSGRRWRPGDAPAWTFLGEYRAALRIAHAFRAGASYSAQTSALMTAGTRPGGAGQRTTGRRCARRRPLDTRPWRRARLLRPARPVRLPGRPESGERRGRFRQRIGSWLEGFASASEQRLAPGAEQFQPPSVAGAWLPPERTFSSLDPDRPLRAERVRHVEAGASILVGPPALAEGGARSTRITVARFHEDAADQIAMLFERDETRRSGHYFVASPGSVAVEGWRMGIAGSLGSHLRGRIDYAAHPG